MHLFEKHPKPIILLDLDGFAKQGNCPHLMDKVGELLNDALTADVQLVLFAENKKILKDEFIANYGEQMTNFYKCIHEAKKEKRIATIQSYLNSHKSAVSLTSNRASSGSGILGKKSESGSGILGRKSDTNIDLVVYYASCDKDELSKLGDTNNSKLILITHTDQAHLESLGEFIEQFKAMKKMRDQAQEKEFELLTYELLHGQKFLTMTRDYLRKKAESTVLGNVAFFMRKQKASFAAEKNFNEVLPQQLMIGNFLNTWNVYDCIVDDLELLKPDLFVNAANIHAELYGYLENLKKGETLVVKKQLSSTFFEKLSQFYSSLDSNKNLNFAADQDKMKIWDQLVADLKRSRNIRLIKKEMLKYINELDEKNSKKNWIKGKLNEDKYEIFLQYLAYTDDDIEQRNMEEGENGAWIKWSQIEIDCVIIVDLFTKLIKKNIILYAINYISIVKMDIITEEKQDDVVLYKDRSCQVSYRVMSVAFDDNEEAMEYLLINGNGVKKIKANELRFGLNSEDKIITFGVNQQVAQNKNLHKTTNQTIITKDSQYVYTRFVANIKKQPRITLDYKSMVTKSMDNLLINIDEFIKERLVIHRNMLQQAPKFPVPGPPPSEDKLVSRNLDKNDIDAEVRRFSLYLEEKTKNYLKDCFNTKMDRYREVDDWFKACLLLIETDADTITTECDKMVNIIQLVQEEWVHNSKQIELRKQTPEYSLKSSSLNLAAAADQPVFEINSVYHAARYATLEVFKKSLEEEKRRFGIRFHINRSTEGNIDIEAFVESSAHLEAMDKKNQLLRGRTLLQNATNRGNADVVQYLLFVERADPDVRLNKMDLPPIFDWVRHLSRKSMGGAEHILDYLLRANADPNIISQNLQAAPGGTFLHYIAELGHFWTIHTVLKYVLSKAGNTRIDLFKKTEKNVTGDVFTPKTAMLCTALHEGFKTFNSDELSNHYKSLQKYFEFGLVFSADEIDLLNSIYKGDKIPFTLLQNLCASPLTRYNAILKTIENLPTNSPTKVSKQLHKDLFPPNILFVDKDADIINVEQSLILVEQWLIRLRLKSLDAQLRETDTLSPPQSARSSSTISEKPKMVRSNSFVIPKSSSSEAALPSSSSKKEISLKGLFSFLRGKDDPVPKKTTSEIVGRSRADSLRELEKTRPGSENLVPPRSSLGGDSQHSVPLLRNRSETAAPKLNLEQDKLNIPSNIPAELTIDQAINIDKETGLALIHNVCITGDIILFYYLINKETVQIKVESTSGNEAVVQNGMYDEANNKPIQEYQLLSVCSKDLRVAFYYVVKFNHFDLVDKFIELKAPLMPKPAQITDCCKTPLHAAIDNLKIAMDSKDVVMIGNIKKLIEKILNYAVETNTYSCIMTKDKNSHTPLIKAAIYEMDDVMKMIIMRRIWIPQLDEMDAFSEKSIPDKAKRKRIIEGLIRIYSAHFQKLLPSLDQSLLPRVTS